LKNVNNTFGGEDSTTLWIDLDEKNFMLFDQAEVLFVPKSQIELVKNIHRGPNDKPDWVMMCCGVARPQFGHNGCVFCLPVAEEAVRLPRPI
jgi:hypothetical protein